MGKKKLKIKIKKEIWEQLQTLEPVCKKKDKKSTINDIISFLINEYNNKSIKNSKLKNKNIKKPPKKIKLPEKEKLESTLEDKLNIPPAPPKKPIKLEITREQEKILKNKETDDIKYILIECPICGVKPITMPVPKDKILSSKKPVVDISYVHGDPQHVIVAQLDHDFQVRRRRASWVVFEADFKK